jgi:hypothetical protein
VPTNTTIELRFDRYLLPATAVRQSLQLFTGAGELTVYLEPEYDVIERVLVYRLEAGEALEPGTLYQVQLISPEREGDFGFRAYDGAPLGEGPVPLRYSFVTERAVPPDPPPRDAVPDCDGILADLGRAGCRSSGCHGALETDPPLGLSLDDERALALTAIDRVAHETAFGASPATPLEDPLRFGIQMPIIDPGNPANSYLLYKLLRKPENYREAGSCSEDIPESRLDFERQCRMLSAFEQACLHEPCGTCYSALLVDGVCLPPSPEEDVRLREWFVRGHPMPLDGDTGTGQPLLRSATKLTLRRLQRWIAAGAPCP